MGFVASGFIYVNMIFLIIFLFHLLYIFKLVVYFLCWTCRCPYLSNLYISQYINIVNTLILTVFWLSRAGVISRCPLST